MSRVPPPSDKILEGDRVRRMREIGGMLLEVQRTVGVKMAVGEPFSSRKGTPCQNEAGDLGWIAPVSTDTHPPHLDEDLTSKFLCRVTSYGSSSNPRGGAAIRLERSWRKSLESAFRGSWKESSPHRFVVPPTSGMVSPRIDAALRSEPAGDGSRRGCPSSGPTRRGPRFERHGRFDGRRSCPGGTPRESRKRARS